MRDLLILNNKLKKYLALVVTLLAPLGMVPLTYAAGWENIPVELQGYTLRKLLESQDYGALFKAYATSQDMRKAIDADPALRETFQGMTITRDSLGGLYKLVTTPTRASIAIQDNMFHLSIKMSDTIFKRGDTYGPDAINNIGNWIFYNYNRIVDAALSEWTGATLDNLSEFAFWMGTFLPEQYLSKVEPLLMHILSYKGKVSRLKPEELAKIVRSAVDGLNKNEEISPESVAIIKELVAGRASELGITI